MKRTFLNILVVFALLAVGASCSKTDTTTVTKYLSGTMEIHGLDVLLAYGSECDVQASGVWHPEAPKVNGKKQDILTWTVYDNLTATTDTLRLQSDPPASKVPVYHFTVEKDTVGTFKLAFSAYYTGYTASSLSQSYVVVKSGYGSDCSIKGFVIPAGSRTETIDGRSYYITEIAGKDWMRENLARTKVGGEDVGKYLYDSPAAKDVFGMYYTGEEALKVCPEGWELPSSEELDAVAAVDGVKGMMADLYFNGTTDDYRMWEYWPKVGVLTDKTLFSAMPSGCGYTGEGKNVFKDVFDVFAVWTRTEDASGMHVRYISEREDILFDLPVDKTTYLASVRCKKK